MLKDIDKDALFNAATEKGLAFHQFAGFIETEIKKFELYTIKRVADPDKFIEEDDEVAMTPRLLDQADQVKLYL